MVITVCVGSSCHLKGSREIISRLQTLISEHNIADQVRLQGSFCLGQCVNGVCVQLHNHVYSLSLNNTDYFFQTEVLGRLT